MESLSICVNELQQQAYAQRVDLEIAHHGYHLGQNDYRYGSFVSELKKGNIRNLMRDLFFELVKTVMEINPPTAKL